MIIITGNFTGKRAPFTNREPFYYCIAASKRHTAHCIRSASFGSFFVNLTDNESLVGPFAFQQHPVGNPNPIPAHEFSIFIVRFILSAVIATRRRVNDISGDKSRNLHRRLQSLFRTIRSTTVGAVVQGRGIDIPCVVFRIHGFNNQMPVTGRNNSRIDFIGGFAGERKQLAVYQYSGTKQFGVKIAADGNAKLLISCNQLLFAARQPIDNQSAAAVGDENKRRVGKC